LLVRALNFGFDDLAVAVRYEGEELLLPQDSQAVPIFPERRQLTTMQALAIIDAISPMMAKVRRGLRAVSV
jgi:hypothetical protein